MIKLVLIGAGGHAKSCFEVINKIKKIKIVGCIAEKSNKKFYYLGKDKDLPSIRKKYKHAHLAIGFIKNYKLRLKILKKLKNLKYIMPTIISKNSIVSKNSKIGAGTIVMNYCIVNYDAQIGDNTIINNRALIEHDVVIGSNCHISTSVTVNGNCKIGDNTFIGSGAVIDNGVSIGKNCIIGSGLIIKKNIKDNEIKKK